MNNGCGACRYAKGCQDAFTEASPYCGLFGKPTVSDRKDNTMNIMYKCSFCGKHYDWYGGVYENEGDTESENEGKSGTLVKANSFVLTRVAPLDITTTSASVVAEKPNSGLDTYINLCSACMHKLLDNLRIDGLTAWDYDTTS